MLFYDSIDFGEIQTTPEGWLVSKARLARAGIQLYMGSEGGLREMLPDKGPTDEIRIYRAPEEVFSEESLASIAGKPITIDHPSDFVDSENAHKLVVGIVGDHVYRDGNHVCGMVRILHKAGVEAVKNGKRELSVGYDMKLDPTPGETPEGELFDGAQTEIRANHVALVERGRCGPSCRMHDRFELNTSQCHCKDQENDHMTTTLKTIDCGGHSIEVTDVAAIAIKQLVDKHAADLKTRDMAEEEQQKKIDELEEKLAKADAENEENKKKIDELEEKTSPEAMDAAARARTALVDAALTLAPKLDCSALDSKAIKLAALKAIGFDTEGRSDTYLDAAFDARVELAKDGNPSAAKRAAAALAAASNTQANDEDAESPRAKYLSRQRDAYKVAAAN
jgi:hypothetical protein